MGAPTIGGDTTGAVTDDSGLLVTGDLDDVGFLAGNTDDTWSIQAGGAASYGVATIDPATGEWTYDLNDDHPTVNALADGETMEDVFTVLMVDADGRFDTQDVTITITGVPCFTAGTLIDTPQGAVPVESLQPGDLVLTLDDGPVPIRWVGERPVGLAELCASEKMRPIRIRAGALGGGRPERDLIVSRQHRVLLGGPLVARLFGEDEVLVPAAKLIWWPGIDVVAPKAVLTYHHILFDRHQVIFAEGSPSESLLVAEQSLRMLGPKALAEIGRIMPDEIAGHEPYPPAKKLVERGKHIKKLCHRAAKNGHDLLPFHVAPTPQRNGQIKNSSPLRKRA